MSRSAAFLRGLLAGCLTSAAVGPSFASVAGVPAGSTSTAEDDSLVTQFYRSADGLPQNTITALGG